MKALQGTGVVIGAGRGALHPRQIRVTFDRSAARLVKPARWHVDGLPLAALFSLALWGLIVAMIAR